MNKFYEQIDKALQSYEDGKSWHEKSVEWICNRIDWAYHWHKISEKEMIELADRIVKVMEG